MSDADETARDDDARTPDGTDRPAGADEDESSRDEITEVTPPDPDEGRQSPEAD